MFGGCQIFIGRIGSNIDVKYSDARAHRSLRVEHFAKFRHGIDRVSEFTTVVSRTGSVKEIWLRDPAEPPGHL
jgi:hypothetical protein